MTFAGLTERQQLALAMEESKKAAAALQAKDRQASRQMDSEVNAVHSIFNFAFQLHQAGMCMSA